jgi:hypothetical protein
MMADEVESEENFPIETSVSRKLAQVVKLLTSNPIRISTERLTVAFLCPPGRITGYYSEIRHDRSLPLILKIYHSLIILQFDTV